jgi:hypothetical protein
MQRTIGLSFVFAVALAIAGCGPSVSDKDLGTVIYKIPKVEGGDQPYELPKVISPTPETTTTDAQEEKQAETDKAEPEKAVQPEQAVPDNSVAPRPRPTPARRP